MLICDRCNTNIPDDTRFCPVCGDPVTRADNPGARPTQNTERVQLICPRCEVPSLLDIPADGSGRETCPHCAAGFTTRVVRIRSKRSAGNRKLKTCGFTVRVEDLSGREDLIEFTRAGIEDFDLKSRDLAAFSSLDGTLRLVQNLTLGRNLPIDPPPPPGDEPATRSVIRREEAASSAAGCGGAAAVLLLLIVGLCTMVLAGGDGPGASRSTDDHPRRVEPATRIVKIVGPNLVMVYALISACGQEAGKA